jgi:chorismate mutase
MEARHESAVEDPQQHPPRSFGVCRSILFNLCNLRNLRIREMNEIERWRKRIDEIDEQLLQLLNERARCAVEIGHLKKKTHQPAWQPERELEILRHVETSNGGPLGDAAIRRLFERIIDEARSLERHTMSEDEAASVEDPERGRRGADSDAGARESRKE